MYSRNFNRVFDRMLTLSRAMDEAVSGTSWNPVTEAAARPQLWLPPVDIYETDSAFVVEADLPGVHQEDVSIQFGRNTLTIEGARTDTLPAKEKAQLRVFGAERLTGKFSRSVRLPEHVDSEKIEATFANGVLSVTVPKGAGALPRKIAIGANREQSKLSS